MKKLVFFYILLACSLTGLCHEPALKLVNTIVLPHVKGSFDLMAADVSGKRLFVSAQDNHSVEVIDLDKLQSVKSLPGFEEPKWIVYRPESERIYVATGLDGKVTVLNSKTFQHIKSFHFKEGCNNLRFDPAKNLLYVGIGKTYGAIGIIDVKNDKITGEIPLSDFPKQFELMDSKMYINVPKNNRIEIADPVKKKVVTTWDLQDAKENVPMGIDRKNMRLFIGCESGKLLIYNLKTEKLITSLPISKETDGVYYDSKRSKIYVSCGEGFIDVISQITPDSYKTETKIKTVQGAGTSLLIPELDRYILAVPQTQTNKAEIRIYKPL